MATTRIQLNNLADVLAYQQGIPIKPRDEKETMPTLPKLEVEKREEDLSEDKETVDKIAQFHERTAQTERISPYITQEEAVEITGKPLVFKETADLVGKLKDPNATIEAFPEFREYNPEYIEMTRKIKMEDSARAHVMKNQDWYMPEEDSAAMREIKRTVVDEDAGALERFFNMHYYIDDPVEGKVRLYDYPYYALRYTNWFEKASSSAIALGVQPIRWLAKQVGAEGLEQRADTTIKRLLDPTDITLTGRKLTEIEGKRAAAFAELPAYYRATNKWNEQVTDFGALISTTSLLSGAAVSPGIQSALRKVGASKIISSSKTLSNFINSPKLARWATQIPKMGAFGFARTPSESVSERARGALWLMAYNSTPYVATWIGPHIPFVSKAFEFGKPMQQMGMPVFVTDVILNTMLSTPQYINIAEQHGWGTPEFWEEAQSVLTWDVLMSWGTRKWANENRDAARNSYADSEASRRYNLDGGADPGKTFTEYRDEYRAMFDKMDSIKPEMFPEIEASIILSDTSKLDVPLDKNMQLTKTQIGQLNKALGVDVKETSPSKYMYEAERQGAQLDRSSPNLHTTEQVKEFLGQVNKEIVETTGKTSGEIGREYIKERLNQKAETIDKIHDGLIEAVTKPGVKETVQTPDVQRMIADNRDITPRGQKIVSIKSSVPDMAQKSRYYERIKTSLGDTDSAYFQSKHIKAESAKAAAYVNSNSQTKWQRAMRVAYGLSVAPKGYSDQAIRRETMLALHAAGRDAEAREIGRIMSQEYTRMGSEINFAKLDVAGAGVLRAEALVRDQRLEAVGKKLPEITKGESGKSKAMRKISTDAKEAAKQVTTEQTKMQTAEKLLDLLMC